MADSRFVQVPGHVPHGNDKDQVAELSRRIGELSASLNSLARMETYKQAAEPQIGEGKLVIWRDTGGAITYLVVRVGGTQYKVVLV